MLVGISAIKLKPHRDLARTLGQVRGWQGFELGAFSAHVCQAHQRSRTRQVKRHTQDANAFETAVGLLKIRLCHELVSMCLLGFA